MIPLTIDGSVSLDSDVKYITAVIYNQESLPIVEQIIDQEVYLDKELCLYRNEMVKGHFWLVLEVRNEGIQEKKHIERVVGLSKSIIGVQLNDSKELFIQSQYLDNFSKTNDNINHSLQFFNTTYSKPHERIKQSISYYNNVKHLRTNPVINGESINTLQIKDVIKIYQQCSLMDWKTEDVVRIYQKLTQDQQQKKNLEKAIQTIFQCKQKDIQSSQMEEKVSKMNLTSKGRKYIMKKVQQIRKYHQLCRIDEEAKKQISSNLPKAIPELPQEHLETWAHQFHSQWTKNTLKQLKKLFNAIANQRDSKAINQFRNYKKECDRKLAHIHQAKVNIQLMQKQIDDYYYYHDRVVRGEWMSSLSYFKNQLRYRWKYDNKVYQRICTFLLITLLASIQNDLSIGGAIFAVGLIISAINI